MQAIVKKLIGARGFSRGGIVGRDFARPSPEDVVTLFRAANQKPPVDPRSTVGFVVVNLNRMHGQLNDRRDDLIAEIERKTEELRQVNAALAPLAKSLTDLSIDPALTTEERELAEKPMDSALAGIGATNLLEDDAEFDRLFKAGFETSNGVFDLVRPFDMETAKGK